METEIDANATTLVAELPAGALLAFITPEVVDALAGAVTMLQNIAKGGTYPMLEYVDRLKSFEDTLRTARGVAL